MTSPRRWFAIASIASLFLLVGASGFPQTGNDAAAQDRSNAAEARGRAQVYLDMAAKAHRRAATSSPPLKQIWEQNAASYEAEAKRLNDEAQKWDQRASEEEVKAQQAQQKAPASAGSGESAAASGPAPGAPPGGSAASPPTASGAGSGPAPNPPSEAPSGSNVAGGGGPPGCSGPAGGEPLTLSQVLGTWEDSDTGEQVEIAEPQPSRPGKLPRDEKGNPIIDLPLGEKPSSHQPIILKGHHQWEGTYEAGKLKVTRFPEPAEMGRGPDWARQGVKNKVEWKLELDAKTECDKPVLTGKWYPGSFKWSEEVDPEGKAQPKRTVSDIGPGNPIDVKYVRGSEHVYLYAKGVFHFYLIDKIYFDTPTFVGIAFEKPYSRAEYPVSVKLNGATLDLTAKPMDSKRKFFATDVFMLKAQ